MTVSSSTSKNTYAGDDSTTVFAFSFPVLDETHFSVEEVNDTTGVVTSKSLTTHYTVGGTGNDTGRTNYTSGNVTMLTAPATGVTLVLKRNLPFLQETDYVENETFPAESHEEALDELTMADQQLKEQIDQSIKFDSSVSFTGTIPAPAADKYLKFNSAADSWELATLSSSAGLGNVVEDISPQLGGDLDLNGNQITSPDGTDLIDIPNGSVDVQTNSVSRLDISDSGVRLGAANARVTTVLDEDTMSSDSATALATQQSIKAYVDTEIATETGNIASDTVTFTNKTFDANGTGNSLTNVDVADLANGTDGELITWDAAGAPTTVAAGTSGQVLTSNGAGAEPTFQAIPESGSLVLLGTATASSSASIDFESLITSTYDHYIITIANAVPATDATQCWLRTSTDNGSTYDNGASDYSFSYDVTYSNTSSRGAGQGTGASRISLGEAQMGSTAGESFNGVIRIYKPSGTNDTLVHFDIIAHDSDSNIQRSIGVGARNSAADVDAAQVLMSSGNIASGDFAIYGVAKT